MRLEVFRLATEMLQYLDPDGLDETVLNIGQIKTSLEEEMQDLPYARPDGIYPDMTVGAVIGADDTAQWAQRVTAGSGAATVRSVQGAAVVWNQLVKIVAGQQTTSGVTITKRADGTVTISGAAASNVYFHLAGASYVPPLVTGNKYLVRGPQQGSGVAIHIPGNTGFNNAYDGQFITAISIGTAASNIYVLVTAGFDGELTFKPQIFDLTVLYGSGNEPTTVTEFEAMYPASYYPYSAPTLKPVQIAGISSTDAQGGELDSVEWPTFTLRGAGTIGDMLYADHVETRVGVVDLGSLTWTYNSELDVFAGDIGTIAPAAKVEFNGTCLEYPFVGSYRNRVDKSSFFIYNVYVGIQDTSFNSDANACKAAMSGVLLFYELATPTTTTISPALPMTYRVQHGGSESIIVPDGEVSAAPVLTVAEPVNAGDEFARIWEAIQSLGYTRNAAQLSRPVSLTDTVSVDETQKDTAEIAEIDTIKEVQE